MENYKIFSPVASGAFDNRIKELESIIKSYLCTEEKSGRCLVYSKIFLSDILNQNALLTASPLYTDILSKSPCTIVGQAPLNGCKIAVLVKTSDLNECFNFQSIRLSEEEACGLKSYMQTLELFKKYIAYLEEHHLNMKTNLVRTWIYITDIDVNYTGVVKARNDIFKYYGLTADTHYIASTGIGGENQSRHACVAMDFLTYPDIADSQLSYLKALDHMNPTHDYGVAFERATRLDIDDVLHYYVSGTASIDKHGDVLYLGDVERQTARLIENIDALLADGNATLNDIRYFIVYLRDVSDYTVVDRIFKKRFSGIPYIIVHAKVCRPEWLIEAECIAEKKLVDECPHVANQ